MENISTNYDIKYRFDTMDSILGNKKTVNFVNTLLKNGNYPNVTIISGPTGAGKSSLAYIIAKTLQCEQGQGRYICNQCKTCQELSKTLYNKGEGKSALGVMTFDMGKIYMMIAVAIVPIIIVYLLLSKYIIAGVTLGGVKG